MGMHVYFPGFVHSVYMSTDCHLLYEPRGKSAPLSSLHYVQPWCAPVIYPAESSAFRAFTAPDPSPGQGLLETPVLIENDGSLINMDRPSSLVDDSGSDLPTFTSLVAKQVHQTPSKISRQAIGLSFLSNFRFC